MRQLPLSISDKPGRKTKMYEANPFALETKHPTQYTQYRDIEYIEWGVLFRERRDLPRTFLSCGPVYQIWTGAVGARSYIPPAYLEHRHVTGTGMFLTSVLCLWH